jgi:DNA-directed RNA polymerase subunit RPC12/RpoP
MLKMRPLSWVIIAVNLLFLFATFSGLSETTKSCDGLTGDDLSFCQAGTAIGAGIGVAVILFFWVLIDVILLIVWLVSNKNQRECTKCGRKIKRGLIKCPKCGHEF